MSIFPTYSAFYHGDKIPHAEVADWMLSIQDDFSYIVGDADVSQFIKTEIIGQMPLLEAWRSWFEFDVIGLHTSNILAKKVVYSHKPYFYISPWNYIFKIKGVNSRLFLAVDKGNSVFSTRFEAISALDFENVSSYYAFKIQYKNDSVGSTWQLIQPSVLFSNKDISVITAGKQGSYKTLLRNLRLLTSFACHDYIHSTMMRWFGPPEMEASQGYKQMLSEREPPVELRSWHDQLVNSSKIHINDTSAEDVRDILEYQAVFIHRKNIQILIERDKDFETILKKILIQFDQELIILSEDHPRIAKHFSGILAWILLSLFTTEAAISLATSCSLRSLTADQIYAISQKLFWGFYSKLDKVNENGFLWNGKYHNIRIPFLHYAACLNEYIKKTKT